MNHKGLQSVSDRRSIGNPGFAGNGADDRRFTEGNFRRELVTLSEVARLRSDVDVLMLIAEWVDEYLMRAHPQLGRSGPVCPFTRGARMRDSIRISVARLGAAPDGNEIIAFVRSQQQEFFRIREAMKEDDRIYTALMIAFPDVSRELWPELIDGTKRALKPEFVRTGLMLGEFHADCDQPGLHSAGFRPLRSPVPMLVMRQMVPSDFAFLSRAEDSPAARMEFLTAYLASQTNLTEAERTRAEEALQTAYIEAASGPCK